MAGALIAADLLQTTKCDPAAADANSGRFAKAPSPFGAGFADDCLLALAPWYAVAGGANGVGFDQSDQSVFRKSWLGER